MTAHFGTPLAIVWIGVLVGLGSVSGIAQAEDDSKVKIWDAGKHWGGMWDAWAVAYKNRSLWKQVPYGKTDYTFQGDTILENKFFYIMFNKYSQNDLHIKKGNSTMWRNILYKTYDDPQKYRIVDKGPGQVPAREGVHYGGGNIYVKILKNTPEELIVENQGAEKPFPVTATYRVVNDKPWVEVRPVRFATEQGSHGKVRMGLAPIEGGNDFVVDSLRDLPSRPHAPESKMLIGFYESTTSPFMWVITWSSPFKEADPWFLNDSGPKGDTMWSSPGTWGGLAIPKKWPGSITSSWAKFGKNGGVVLGGLPYWNNWYREHVDKSIKKGQKYTVAWKPPYPGRWRLTARVAESRYDQGFNYDGRTTFPAKYFSKDVYDGHFTFESPIAGILDYVIVYMYDRTEETPADILTPMDQYRWTVKQKE